MWKRIVLLVVLVIALGSLSVGPMLFDSGDGGSDDAATNQTAAVLVSGFALTGVGSELRRVVPRTGTWVSF